MIILHRQKHKEIWLHVDYNYLSFDSYTNFSFPGVNIYAVKLIGKESSDKLYIYNVATSEVFDDQKNNVNKIKFLLHHNSISINADESNILWSFPLLV